MNDTTYVLRAGERTVERFPAKWLPFPTKVRFAPLRLGLDAVVVCGGEIHPLRIAPRDRKVTTVHSEFSSEMDRLVRIKRRDRPAAAPHACAIAMLSDIDGFGWYCGTIIRRRPLASYWLAAHALHIARQEVAAAAAGDANEADALRAAALRVSYELLPERVRFVVDRDTFRSQRPEIERIVADATL
ncbi:MAG: hypothetical protein D6689_00440 [Deltaproteobacteria bacterium]|nr:MAG: hypothetical protein D6689_00440 [Deltaproteobacteria bacterium]